MKFQQQEISRKVPLRKFRTTTKQKIKWQNCLKAMGKTFHPECFACAYCGKIFANSPFYLEDGLPYCEEDWNELFTTKCINCGFPIEAGDRWVEALDNNYHSQCFNCTLCKKNLEGKRFFVKAGKPFCKSHATRAWTSIWSNTWKIQYLQNPMSHFGLVMSEKVCEIV